MTISDQILVQTAKVKDAVAVLRFESEKLSALTDKALSDPARFTPVEEGTAIGSATERKNIL